MIKEFFLNGRQRSVMLILLLMMAVAAFAVPAKPGLTRTLTLADGTTVNAVLVGDEHGHFWRGADGKSYQSVAGTDFYQAVNSQGIIQKAQQRRTKANSRRTKRLTPRRVGNGGTINGKKKGLIILVNYQDVAFQSENNAALYRRIANEEGFSYQVNNSDYSFKGSMYDYFKAQSEGQFELTFDVVGPVTISREQAYYGGNNSQGNDMHPAEMVIEALKLVDSEVNFKDYDWDDDGEVEQVYVIYAGNGEADSYVADAIWPHEWTLGSANYYGEGEGPQTLDEVKIDTYACGGELNGGNLIAGIGTMCHEFSHCLGYPDFYDTDYSGGQGMGYWDLMCNGSYNDYGYQPAGYTSYERWVAGWKTPITLETTQTISDMAALQTYDSNAYVIYNKANNNEYYLLENRQKTGWDASLPGAGLLILHVDYDAEIWGGNQTNDDPDHQRMTWIPADKEYQYNEDQGTKRYTFSGMAHDPFPYGSFNAFGKNTTPAATLYNDNLDGTKFLDCSILNITQNNDGTISFNFNGESNVVPVYPAIVADETLTFSTTVGTPQTKTLSVLTEGLTQDVTLTLTDDNSVFSLGSSTISKDEEVAEVDVTFTPTAAGTYTGSITLTSDDAETVTVQLTASARELVLPSIPDDLDLPDVTSSSMTATWSAADNATSYEIDVVKGSTFEASPGKVVLESDFSNTTGWTLSGTGTYTGAGYYGAGSPSIKFDGTGDYAISPDFGSGAKLQFWAYGNNGDGSSFKISGLVNSVWTDIETVSIAKGGATYEVNLPAGTSQVRFDFTKSVNCALDDVVIYAPSNSPESVDGYPQNVGDVTSYDITGLTSNTQYAVRVRAVNDDGNSDWSSTATATTTVANSAPVWSAFPNANTTLGGEDIELTISDYVSGTPTPTIALASTTANSADYDFDPNDGYFTFTPSATGTFTFTFTATNSEGSANATLTVTVNPAPVTVPTLAFTESGITATTAPVSWDACDGVSSYTLQLASDDEFSTGTAGSQVTLFSNDATSTTAPSDWTYNIANSSGNYLQLTTSSNYVISEAVDASNCTSLTISYKQRTYGGTSGNSNNVLVEYSTNNGTSWTELGTTTASSTTLTIKSLDVSAVAGMGSVRFRLSVPEATSNKGCGISTIVLTGTESANDGSLIFTQTVSGTSYTFTGLTSGSTYYARVKGNDDWSNVVTFTTKNTPLDLANNGDNSSAIATAATNGGKYDVTLSNRTLWKDGAWNTLCLPFGLSSFDGTPLEGATVMTLGNGDGCNTGFDATTGTLALDFVDANSIEAGHAYIVKWNTTGEPIENPVFTGVTIENEAPADQSVVSTDGSVTFLGTYSAQTFATDNKSILLMGDNNTLYWPLSGASIGAQRAYFQLGDGLTAGDPSNSVKGFVLNFGEEDATIIHNSLLTIDNEASGWYDLKGRKLNGTPKTKGIYIANGKKVVIK